MSLTIESSVNDGEENVNFEPDDDTTETKAPVPAAASSTSSSSTGESDGKERKKIQLTKKSAPKQKGRGFKRSFEEGEGERASAYAGKGGKFESVGDDGSKSDAQKSVEGWIVFISGVNEEAQEDDIYDMFADCGEIKQISLNLDRRTGYVKGYALIEYEKFSEADLAIRTLNGQPLLETPIKVDWAFKRPPPKAGGRSRGSRRREEDE